MLMEKPVCLAVKESQSLQMTIQIISVKALIMPLTVIHKTHVVVLGGSDEQEPGEERREGDPSGSKEGQVSTEDGNITFLVYEHTGYAADIVQVLHHESYFRNVYTLIAGSLLLLLFLSLFLPKV